MKFRRRLTVPAAICLAVAGVGAFLVQGASDRTEAARQEAEANVQDTLRWVQSGLGQSAQALQSLISMAAIEAARGGPQVCERVEIHTLNRFPGGRVRLEIRDESGRRMCANTSEPLASEAEAAAELSRSRHSFVSGRAYSFGPEGPQRRTVIPYASPWASDGAGRGTVLAYLDTAHFEETFGRGLLPRQVSAWFLTRSGDIVASVPTGVREPAPSEFRRLAAVDGQASQAIDLPNGDKRLAAGGLSSGWDLTSLGVVPVVVSEVGDGGGIADTLLDVRAALFLVACLAVILLVRRTGPSRPSDGVGQPDPLVSLAALREIRENRPLADIHGLASVHATMIENSADLLFAKDSEGKYLEVNASFLRMMGLQRKDVIGFTDVLRDVSINGVRPSADARRKVVASGEVSVFEMKVWHHQFCEERIFSFTYVPMRAFEGGAVIGVTATGHDITEAHRSEHRLLTAKEAVEEASRSKTRFLAATSHDLRQPAQAATLFAESLARHVVGTPGEAQLRSLQLSLEAMNELLKALMGLSELESGAVKPIRTEFALTPLLEEVRATLVGQAESKALPLIIVPADVVVVSDRVLLGRMIRNLADNAIKYTQRGRILIDCSVRGDNVLIEVRDSGIGMDERDLKRIWDEFLQLNNPERDRSRGLGLGLSVVRRLSELLGHPVTVRSEKGLGSTFTLEISTASSIAIPAPPAPTPMLPAMPQASPVTDWEEPEDGAPLFLVVIDDEAGVREGLKSILEDFGGYEVAAAESASEALALVRTLRRRPDAMLVDYRLRNNAVGSDAIRALRAAYAYPLPALILTGDINQAVKKDAEELKVEILHKPISPKDLLPLLADLLSSAKPLREP